MSKNAIILDFDGTISDYSDRAKYRDIDWNKYIELSYTDIPNRAVISLINKFKYTHEILIVTARAESSREETVDWLNKYNIHYDRLIMKQSNHDAEEDGLVKSLIIKKLIEVEEYDILFCVDDRDCCVKYLRDLGLTVFQCGYGY